jgi:SAM-dependent methyltransferase
MKYSISRLRQLSTRWHVNTLAGLYYCLPRYIRQRARHDHQVFLKCLERINKYQGASSGKHLRVLELGCGNLPYMTMFFSSMGCDVIGTDINPIPTAMDLRHRLKARVASKDAEGFVLDLLPRSLYFKELMSVSTFPLNLYDLKTINMDACKMCFNNDTFDLIVSNAAFEHISDVESVFLESWRVARKGALAHINIHLFPSLTGGHQLVYAPVDWGASPPKSGSIVFGPVPPWDHLRQNSFSLPPLNKLRERDYRRIIDNTDWQVLEWETDVLEPEQYLTPEIYSELTPKYSKEELLKRGINVVLRK